jgi:hypothetical protein
MNLGMSSSQAEWVIVGLQLLVLHSDSDSVAVLRMEMWAIGFPWENTFAQLLKALESYVAMLNGCQSTDAAGGEVALDISYSHMGLLHPAWQHPRSHLLSEGPYSKKLPLMDHGHPSRLDIVRM